MSFNEFVFDKKFNEVLNCIVNNNIDFNVFSQIFNEYFNDNKTLFLEFVDPLTIGLTLGGATAAGSLYNWWKKRKEDKDKRQFYQQHGMPNQEMSHEKRAYVNLTQALNYYFHLLKTQRTHAMDDDPDWIREINYKMKILNQMHLLLNKIVEGLPPEPKFEPKSPEQSSFGSPNFPYRGV